MEPTSGQYLYQYFTLDRRWLGKLFVAGSFAKGGNNSSFHQYTLSCLSDMVVDTTFHARSLLFFCEGHTRKALIRQDSLDVLLQSA